MQPTQNKEAELTPAEQAELRELNLQVQTVLRLAMRRTGLSGNVTLSQDQTKLIQQ